MQNSWLLLLPVLLSFPAPALGGESQKVVRATSATSGTTTSLRLVELRSQLDKWIGEPAPPLGENAVDRISGSRIDLAGYRGRTLLLFAFHSGNFVESVDDARLSRTLEVVYRVCDSTTTGKLAVIGFTSGTDMFSEHFEKPVDPELKRLTSFPLVLPVNREFPEPYKDIMHAITYETEAFGGDGFVMVISPAGKIRAILYPPLHEGSLRQAIEQQAP